ncbi:MAG: glycosyltransferase family 9 protein [Deltaproteobacteria bacterium]|nr:glycosyltransferase family 9 protein [Deltaproteobacteria bacterium]
MTDTLGAIRRAKNILVIQLGDIGDVVLTTPSLRALKETLPEAKVSALVRRGFGSLLEEDPNLHEVIEVAKSRGKLAEIGGENFRLIRRLRRVKYDLAIDLRTGDRGTILAFLTGAPVKVTRYDPGRPFWHNRIFNHRIMNAGIGGPPVHPGVDLSLRLLRTLGIDTADSTPRLWVSKEAVEGIRSMLQADPAAAGCRWATANPFSRWKYKEWGRDRWIELIGWLWNEHGLRTVLVGSRDEAGAAEGIASKCGGGALNFAGKTTLGELAALLSLSTIHLGVDSAAPHIAFAVGTPSVTIFGPSDWRVWTVQDDIHRIVTPDDDCVPCQKKGCDGKERSVCLENMGTEKMKAAVGEILRAPGRRTATRRAGLP